MSSDRPKKPHDPRVKPRAVTDSLTPSVQQAYQPPTRPLGEDLLDEVMRSHTEGACDLGLYREEDDQALRGAGRLGGQPQPIAFERAYWSFFQKLTPEFRAVVLWFADAFRDHDRQSALIEIVDERIERRVLRNFFKRLKHGAIFTFVTTAAAAHWFSDQMAWVVEKVPVLKAFWNLITGAR